MKVGDVVSIKGYVGILGEITCMTEDNRAILSLCDTGIRITVDTNDLCRTVRKQVHRIGESVVNILGTRYTIRALEEDDYRYNDESDGWCDFSTKEIVVFNHTQKTTSVDDLVAYQKKVLRHEIVHAFLYESGLWYNSCKSKCWAKNEEMVDWIAIQEPKLHKAFKEAGCEE